MKLLTKEWKRESDLYERCMEKMLKRGIFSFAKWGKVLDDIAETALAETKAASGETGLAEELDDLLYRDVFGVSKSGNGVLIEFGCTTITVTDCEVSEWEAIEIGKDKPILYGAELYALESGKHELHLLIGDKDSKNPIKYYCITVAGHVVVEQKA